MGEKIHESYIGKHVCVVITTQGKVTYGILLRVAEDGIEVLADNGEKHWIPDFIRVEKEEK